MEAETSETNILPIRSLIYDDSIDTSSIQNVLLIDSSVKEFQQYANANTFPIVYTRSCTREQLLSMLSSKFNNISRIAIVCHFSESPVFLNEDLLFSETNTQCIVDITKQFHLSHIDFLACDTLQSTLWTTFYATLYAATGIPIGASNDNTGNIKYGGDWILESTLEDIQTIYFNDQIQNYSSLLLSFKYPYPNNIGVYVSLNYTIDLTNLLNVYVSTQSSSLSGTITIPNIAIYKTKSYQVTSIYASAFSSCSSIVSIVFDSSSSIQNIGNYAFQNAVSLNSIVIPPGVTRIGLNAFKGCVSLTDVSFASPSSVTTIGETAFQGCTSLESITIPSSVNIIDPTVFKSCSKLTSITVEGSNAQYSNDSFNVLFNKNKTILYKYPSGNSRTTYTIPSSVTQIVSFAFQSCSNLESISFEGTSFVTSIGSNAFEFCNRLTSIVIPDSVESIGANAFGSCDALTSAILPTNNKFTILDNGIFNTDTSLNSILIPNSITSIGVNAFKSCRNLTSITFNGIGITSIGSNAFQKCDSLTNIAIPTGVTSLSSYMFESCTSLQTISISYTVTVIGDNVFQNCLGLTSINIPPNVTSIGSSSFQGCPNITQVYFYGNYPQITAPNFENIVDTAYYLQDNSGSFVNNSWNLYFTNQSIFTITPQGPPTNISSPEISDKYAKIIWTAPTSSTGSYLVYKITYWLTTTPSNKITTPFINDTLYYITGLTVSSSYTYYIIAYNNIMISSKSPENNFTTTNSGSSQSGQPSNTPGNVDISGNIVQQETLTAILTDIDTPLTNIRYLWRRSSLYNGTYISILNASTSSYILTQTDVDQYIQVTVTYTDANYNNQTATRIVGPIMNILDVGTLSITGTPNTNNYLFAIGTDIDGISNDTYQWSSSATIDGSYSDIQGATDTIYLLTYSDIGKYIQVTFMYNDTYNTDPDNKVKLISTVGPITHVDNPGSVDISGNILQNQQLEAVLTDIDTPTTIISYQWLMSNTFNGSYNSIPDANGLIYTLTQSDVGKYIKVTISYTDTFNSDNDTSHTITSSYKGPIKDINDLGSIIISGNLINTQLLTANLIDIDSSLSYIVYNWTRSNTIDGPYVNIPYSTGPYYYSKAIPASSSILDKALAAQKDQQNAAYAASILAMEPDRNFQTYLLTSSDVGKYIKLNINYKDIYGSSTVSSTIGPIEEIIQISGNMFLTQNITAIVTPNINNPITNATYQWLTSNTADGSYTPILNAYGLIYTLTPTDIGKYIKIMMVYNNSDNPVNTISAISLSRGPINNQGLVTITGAYTRNQLTAVLTDLDTPINNKTYQWLISNTVDGIYNPIPDASNSIYDLSQNNIGKYIKVIVNYNDFYNNSVNKISVTSVPVGPIPFFVSANICFKAGTHILTDQGIVNIENIIPEQHTISGKKVLFVSKTANIDNYMILMKKGSLYKNTPNEDTFLTGGHKVLYNRDMIKAKQLLNGITITKEKSINEIVYNVLLEGEKQGRMIANGMITETLHPSNLFIKLLMKLNQMNEEDRMLIIPKINESLCLANEKREKEREKLSILI